MCLVIKEKTKIEKKSETKKSLVTGKRNEINFLEKKQTLFSVEMKITRIKNINMEKNNIVFDEILN